MATPQSPQFQKAVELLADGMWKEREWVAMRVGNVIPPGKALRWNEERRIAGARLRASRGVGGEATNGRVIQRSTDYRIAVARRRLSLAVLRNTAFETKQEEGKAWVRLRPDRVQRLRNTPKAAVEVPTEPEQDTPSD